MRSQFRTTLMLVRLVIKVLRGTLPLTVIFLIGAGITVGVAWYLAVNINVGAYPVGAVMFKSTHDTFFPTMTLWRHAGAERVLSLHTYGGSMVPDGDFETSVDLFVPKAEPPVRYPTWSREGNGGASIPSGAASSDTVVEDARGWPYFALRCSFHLRGGVNRGARSGRTAREIFWQHKGDACFGASLGSGGIPLATSDGQPDMIGRTARALPLIPIWPGFLANTMIFSAPLLVPYGLWWAVHLIRRRKRRRRGCCLECGHQLIAGQFTCPECGVSTGQATESSPETPCRSRFATRSTSAGGRTSCKSARS